MNETFELESNIVPTNLGVVRLLKFYKTIQEEVYELLQCTDEEGLEYSIINDLDDDVLETTSKLIRYYERLCLSADRPKVNMTALADTLGDLVVYIFSEAERWGLPLPLILNIIMNSQASKLVDGKPLKSPDGAKFIKGPDFEPPEPKIRALLEVYDVVPE